MQRILSIRIVKWYFKLLYAAGVWFAGYPVIAVVELTGAPSFVASAANTLVTLAGILLGARLFRGRGEPIARARPWWQMTARRSLSRALGLVALLFVLSSLIGLLSAAFGVKRSIELVQPLPEYILTAGFACVLAFLYLNSAARLPKPPIRPRERKFNTPGSTLR